MICRRCSASPPTRLRRGAATTTSVFVDMARRKVVYVAEGKDAATVKEFADFLEAHGGTREAVTDASIDMGAAFAAGIKENFPNAEITFDKFHVIKLANEAVDQVRREEARNNFRNAADRPTRRYARCTGCCRATCAAGLRPSNRSSGPSPTRASATA